MKPSAPKLVPVESVSCWPGNARTHNLAVLKESLEVNGQYRPLLVQKSTGRILAGNGTYTAARELGWPRVLVSTLDVDDEQATRIVLVDNRASDLADYDNGLLAELLGTLDDLAGTGFGEDDLDELLASVTVLEPATSGDTEPGEPPAQPRSREGDLWVCGEHRVRCGDSTDPLVVEDLMDGALAHVVFTDPPYGVDYQGGANKRKRERLTGDHLGTTIYADSVPMALTFSDAKAPLYLWFADAAGKAAYQAVADAGYTVRALLVWHKLNAHYGAFMAQYMPKHEPMLYCVKAAGARWEGPTNEVTLWEVEQPARNEFHPTQKPVELAERAITNSSQPGDIVLDLFGGSGSTLIACENTGRKARLVELDPRYADVIIDRWERHTGRTAVRA